MNSLRKLALVAGAGYLIIFFSGIFANFFVLEQLVSKGNAAETWENIVSQASLFRLGVALFIIMVLFDLVLTWALYVLFKPVNAQLSLFAAWFRLVNCAIFGVALFNLFDVIELTAGREYISLVNIDYAQAELMRSISRFNYTWLLGLLFFGIHLLALGSLTLQSGFIPKFIGYLLFLAGAGYLIDSFAQFLLANYTDYQDIFMMIVVIPGIVGELSFTIWLLAKGGKK